VGKKVKSNCFITAGGMVSVCLADFFTLPPPLMANCTIPQVMPRFYLESL